MKEDNSNETKILIEKSINLLEEATKTRPHYTRNWIILGTYNKTLMKTYGENKIKETEYAFEKAYTLSPNRYEVVASLNSIYVQTENYPKIIETYSKLIELDPDDPQYYASLAFAYKKIGEIEKAKTITLKIIELFPEHEKEARTFLESLK